MTCNNNTIAADEVVRINETCLKKFPVKKGLRFERCDPPQPATRFREKPPKDGGSPRVNPQQNNSCARKKRAAKKENIITESNKVIVVQVEEVKDFRHPTGSNCEPRRTIGKSSKRTVNPRCETSRPKSETRNCQRIPPPRQNQTSQSCSIKRTKTDNRKPSLPDFSSITRKSKTVESSPKKAGPVNRPKNAGVHPTRSSSPPTIRRSLPSSPTVRSSSRTTRSAKSGSRSPIYTRPFMPLSPSALSERAMRRGYPRSSSRGYPRSSSPSSPKAPRSGVPQDRRSEQPPQRRSSPGSQPPKLSPRVKQLPKSSLRSLSPRLLSHSVTKSEKTPSHIKLSPDCEKRAFSRSSPPRKSHRNPKNARKPASLVLQKEVVPGLPCAWNESCVSV